jgi:hypothetical protein
MGEFRRVSAGDDVSELLLSSRFLNGAIDAITGGDFGAASATIAGRQRSIVCKIRNDSGADIAQYGILGVDAPLYDKTANSKVFLGRLLQFKGLKPKAEHAGRTAHLLEPIKNGKIGLAEIPCAVQCQVNVVTATHRFASIVDDDTAKLKSFEFGQYPFVPAETGTGTKWGVVFLAGVMQPVSLIFGTTTAAFSGTNITVNNIELVLGVDPRTDPLSSTETLSGIENKFAWNVGASKTVLALKKKNGTWTAIQAQC